MIFKTFYGAVLELIGLNKIIRQPLKIPRSHNLFTFVMKFVLNTEFAKRKNSKYYPK
jgi:hypothetical protein